MSAVTTEEKTEPKLSTREQHRRHMGVIAIARNVHLAVNKADITERHRRTTIEDVGFLQRSLENWNDDDSHFGKAAKQLVEAAIAEAAVAWRKGKETA